MECIFSTIESVNIAISWSPFWHIKHGTQKPKAAASQTGKRRQASRQRKVGDKNIWKTFLCGKAKRANRQGYHLFVRQCKRQRERERRHCRLPAVANPLFLTRLHRSHEATANVGTPGTLLGRFASLFSIPRRPTGQDDCQSFSLWLP